MGRVRGGHNGKKNKFALICSSGKKKCFKTMLFFNFRDACVLSFSLLLCLEPCKKFSVGGGGWWWFTVNLAFCFGPKLWFWTWNKLNKNCSYDLCQEFQGPKYFFSKQGCLYENLGPKDMKSKN